MAATTASALDYCVETAMPPGSLFEFSSRFAPPRQAQALLPLYALQQALGSIPRSALDDEAKWAKLKWWGEELAADPKSAARHPIVQALTSSGAREHIDAALLQRLVHDAAYQIEAPPPADEEAFYDRAAAYGGTGILLELALGGAGLGDERLRRLGAASSVYGLLIDALANPGLLSRYLPPDLLAASGYRAGVPAAQQGRALRSAAEHACALARDWYGLGLSGLDLGQASERCVHLQLRWALEHRQLSRPRRQPVSPARAGRLFGPSDAWFAWRFCRRLQRN